MPRSLTKVMAQRSEKSVHTLSVDNALEKFCCESKWGDNQVWVKLLDVCMVMRTVQPKKEHING